MIRKIVLALLILAAVPVGAATVNYEFYLQYSDTTADSIPWWIISDNALVDSGTMSAGPTIRGGKQSGVYVDTVSIDDGLLNPVVHAEVWENDLPNPVLFNLLERANILAVSGDATVANSWESMLDGTGGVDLDLKNITITNAAGNAVTITGGLGGGDPITGHGISITSNYGDGIRAVSNANGYDINADIQGTVTSAGSVTGAVGSVTGAVGSVTSGVTLAAGQPTKVADSAAQKVWAYTIRTMTPGNWTTTQIDSVLAALRDVNIGDKVWADYSTRTLSSFGFSVGLAAGEYTKIGDTGYAVFTSGTNENAFKATGFSTHNAADVWASGTRTLTALDEDVTAIDLNGTVVVAADTMAGGDSLARRPTQWSADDTAAYQGTASGLTAGAVADAVWDEAHADHVSSGSFGGKLNDSLDAKISSAGSVASISDGDMAAIADTLKNRDSLAFLEGFWHKIANRADSGASGLGDTTLADVSFIRNNPDSFKATGFSSHTPQDVWQYGTRVLTSYPWNSTTVDSVLNAIDDANKGNFKATGFSTHNAADVYSYFTQSLNESAFWLPDSVRQQIAGIAADSVGSITANVDSAAVANAVWNTPSVNHTTAGTFGKYLDVEVSSISGVSGSGAYTYEVVLLDTSAMTDTVVTGARVYVNNTAQNATPYWSITDISGTASFNLDAGTYVMFTTRPGFDQNIDTFTVSAAATDTLPLNRGTGGRTSLSWILQAPNGQKFSYATATFDLLSTSDSLLRIGDSTIVADAQRTVLDTATGDGILSVDLWANSLFTNDSTWYRVTVRDRNGHRIYKQLNFRMPDSSGVVDFNDVTRW